MKHILGPLEKNDYVPEPQEANIAKTILQGQKYMNTHIPQKSSVLRLVYDQIHYISPWLWLAQFIALLLLIVTAFTANDMSYDTAKNTMLLLAPLTTIFAVPEFFKDVSCGVLEIEMTCKNNSASIFSIRLILIGFINISMITIFASTLSITWGLRFVSVILCGLIPCNVIYIINFFVFRLLKICGRLSVLSCSLLTGILVFIASTRITVLTSLNETAWIVICVLTSIILIAQCIHEILCISKRQGVILWNF